MVISSAWVSVEYDTWRNETINTSIGRKKVSKQLQMGY